MDTPATDKEKTNDYAELLSVLCHDLAGPLQTAAETLKLVDDHESFQLTRDTLRLALDAGMEIMAMIRRLRRIEAGGEDFRIETLPLRELVDESLMILRPMLENKRIEIAASVPPELLVKVEPVSFVESVLNNILANAVKFSHRGGTVKIEAAVGDNEVTSLKIIDSGIGVPAKILEDIFKLNRATSRPGTEGEAGAGYGLPLAKRTMTANGGDLEIHSNATAANPEGQGTTAIIKFSPRDC